VSPSKEKLKPAFVAEKTAKKQRGRPFQKGESGNPAGRPCGSRNKTTLAMEAMLDGEAEAIVRKAIEKAKNGDTVALRMCLERLVPVRKDRPLSFPMPLINSAADAVSAVSALVAAVAAGEVTPSEAAELSKLIEGYMKSLEVRDLAGRIANLEMRIAYEPSSRR
jgi:hypothetical protein